jgi:hypothetical protein
MFAWSQLASPVLISEVSLTGRQTWQNVNSKRSCSEFKVYRKGKDIRKKRHSAAFVFVTSVFGLKFSTAVF